MYKSHVAEASTLATALSAAYIDKLCNVCFKGLQKPANFKRCRACKFVHYCSTNCANLDWQGHKAECVKLAGDDEWYHMPHGLISTALILLIFRLFAKQLSGELRGAKANYSGKTFETLASHAEPFFESDEAEMRRKRDSLMDAKAVVEHLLGRSLTHDEFFYISSRVAINAQTIDVFLPHPEPVQDGRRGESTCVGSALSLDYAAYDHSCRPNVQKAWLNGRLFIIPLPDDNGAPLVDAHDINRARVTYTALGAPKGCRRPMLKAGWFFDCECERCVSPEGGLMVGIRCSKCSEPIPVDDEMFRHVYSPLFRMLSASTRRKIEQLMRKLPGIIELLTAPQKADEEYFGPSLGDPISCLKCKFVQPFEHVEFAHGLMSMYTVIEDDRYDELHAMDPWYIPKLTKRVKDAAAKVLADSNIYLAKLRETCSLTYEANKKVQTADLVAAFNAVECTIPRGHFLLFPYLLKYCHSLLFFGSWSEAEPLLVQLEESITTYFGFGTADGAASDALCPFMPRVRYLRKCLEGRKKACDLLEYHTLLQREMDDEIALVENLKMEIETSFHRF